jgi:hypothetical protein
MIVMDKKTMWSMAWPALTAYALAASAAGTWLYLVSR